MRRQTHVLLVLCNLLAAGCGKEQPIDKLNKEVARVCLFAPQEKLEMAAAISAAVAADPNFAAMQDFLTVAQNAWDQKPPDGVAWGFRYSYGNWVSDPSLGHKEKRLFFDKHWELKGDGGYPNDDCKSVVCQIELLRNGLTILSYYQAGDPLHQENDWLSAGQWNMNSYTNELSDLSGWEGLTQAQTPATTYLSKFSGGESNHTFKVTLKNFSLKMDVASTGGVERAVSAVFQGQSRTQPDDPSCPSANDEIRSLRPVAWEKFKISLLLSMLTYQPVK